MEKLSHSRHHHTLPKKTCNSIYDDVFSRPPGFTLAPPSLSPRVQDYAEIFGAFNSRSIPVLDLPLNEDDVFLDVRSSAFDYSEVFGGFSGSDFATSFEELVMQSNGDDDNDEAWSPEEGEYLSEESDGSLKNEGFSNRESCEYVVDGNDMKFNISYNKVGGRSSCEDIAQFQPVPEYTFVVDKTGSLPKMDDDDDDYGSTQLSDDGHFNIELSRELIIERPLKKTMSNPDNSKGGMPYGDDVRNSRDYVRTVSVSNETFVTISDVSLKTRPSQGPPPSRPPPPALDAKQKDSNKLIPNGKTSAFGGSVGDTSPPYFDVEVDANSSAAVSAAAMKEAMEKAQAKMKSAKELMERKTFQSRNKSGLKDHRKNREGIIASIIDGLESNDGIETEIAEDRQYVKRTSRLVPDALEGEKYQNGSKREETQARDSLSSQGSVRIDESSEWKEATEFFELVRTDKSKSIFDNVINESILAWRTNVIEHGMKEQKENDKKGKPATMELEDYERKANISKEFSAIQETNGKLEATVAVQRQKGLQKKAERSQEASRQKNNEKKLMIDLQLAEMERNNMKIDDLQINGNMDVQYQEIKLEAKEATRHKEKEPQAKKANKRSDEEKRFTHERKGTERRQREALEQLDNEKKLNAALEQASNDRRLKEDMMEQLEREKRVKEAYEREENEKNTKAALELEENKRRLKEVLELEESERRLREAVEQEENERRLREALEREENERRMREALEREENERRLIEAFEKQENERRQKETFEKEQKERRLWEALEKEENERRLRQNFEKEENERKLRQKLEKEDNERRLRQKLEKEGNERRQRLAAEQEENEKSQRDAFEKEENEWRLKEALEKKEKEKRDKRACEKGDDERLKMAFELEGPQKKQVEASKREEIHKGLGDDFRNVKAESIGRTLEKIEQEENKSLRGAQVGKEAEEGPKEIHNREDFGDTSPEACKPEDMKKECQDAGNLDERTIGPTQLAGKNGGTVEIREDTEDIDYGALKSIQGELRSNQNEAAGSRTHENNDKGTTVEQAQVSQHHDDRKDELSSTRMVKETFETSKKVKATKPARPAQQVNASQDAERKMKNCNDSVSVEDKETERIKREKELEEMERIRRMEEEREREREREKDRMAVDIATLEARERANSDARERAERAAIERALAEARQRAMNEARERLEKACAEAREKSLNDKSSVEARIRAERAAVERATAEARERAFEKAMAERAASEARERLERSVSDKFSAYSRNSGMRSNSLSSDLQDVQMQNSGSFNGSRYSSAYGGSYNLEGESPQRCKARLERHRRTAERAAKALAEKNMRDLLAQREQTERNRIAETLDAEVRRWSSGKEGNLRALLSTLQYILGPDSGWHPIPLTEVITSAAVKKAYRKATLCVHPDKLQQRGASIHQKYICEKVFDLLKEAWNKFNSEER